MGQPQDSSLIAHNNNTNHPSTYITISNKSLLKAEEIAQNILSKIQPNQDSELIRNAVSNYFNFLLRVHFGIQVKLIKCLVRSMVVDISFNQHGGLFTLSFLEEIDRIIGQDHLFKRSIILTKAWCYYESRVLGAHCKGLISFTDFGLRIE
ncbi:hypothetical protein ACHQM5_016266 [Ranunculus cassubicifolius]